MTTNMGDWAAATWLVFTACSPIPESPPETKWIVSVALAGIVRKFCSAESLKTGTGSRRRDEARQLCAKSSARSSGSHASSRSGSSSRRCRPSRTRSAWWRRRCRCPPTGRSSSSSIPLPGEKQSLGIKRGLRREARSSLHVASENRVGVSASDQERSGL